MYSKRILILSQTDGRFAVKNRSLCGIVKLANINGGTDVTVFVANADVSDYGAWWLLLSFGGKNFAHCIANLQNETFRLDNQDLTDVGCLLMKKDDKLHEACRAFVGQQALCDALLVSAERLVDGTPSPTSYERFSRASASDASDVEEFQAQAREKFKSVEEYSSAFERYYAVGRGDNYYQTVKREISKVFLQFPPYYPLIKKYPQSFFVRIDFPSSEKYFVLGLLQRDDEVRYICYGLPAEKEGFSDKDFIFVESSPTPFWMLFQDAATGRITTLA